MGPLAMSFVLLAATCSVLVSVLLKLAGRHGIDTAQAVTWNYLVAALLCALLLHAPLDSLHQPGAPWVPLLVLAVVLPSLFLVLAASVRAAGIVRTDIAQRLSLLLSLLAAFLWFGESAEGMKLAGLGLGLVAVVALLARPQAVAARAGAARTAAWPLLLTVWAGFALVDVMLKQIAAAGTPFAASLQVSFALAFVGMLAVQGWRHARGRSRFSWRNAGAGVLLGLLNFGNIVFYVHAHRALPENPSLVFAAMNIGVVVLGTLVGVLVFREKPGRMNWLGIALAVPAIVLIAMSR
jgi:EamA-like transporter family.